MVLAIVASMAIRVAVSEYVGLRSVNNRDEIIWHHDGQDISIKSFLAKEDDFLRWFEANPTRPYVACLAGHRLLIIDARSKSIAYHYTIPTGISRLRWKSPETLIFSMRDQIDHNSMLVCEWHLFVNQEPKVTAHPANRFQEAAELRRPWKIDLTKALPSGPGKETSEWDLNMQGLIPFGARRLAFEDNKGSVRIRDDGFDIFVPGQKSWESLARITGRRFAIARSFGSLISITYVQNPNPGQWTGVYGIRAKLSDAGNPLSKREMYTTYLVDSNRDVQVINDLAYAVQVKWSNSKPLTTAGITP